VPPVRKLLSDPNPYHRARATWLLAQLGPAGVREVERLTGDADPQIRVSAFRALRQVKGDVLAEARRLARDPSPAVRREIAISLRDVSYERSRDVLLELARGYDGDDRWYLEALGTGAAGKEDALHAALLSHSGDPDPIRWNASLARIAWRLHPPAAIDPFKARAGSADLPPDAREQALVALGFTNDPRAAQAMADLTRSALPDVASQAGWWMAYRKANDWRHYPAHGWSVTPPAGRPVSLDQMVTARRLVLDAGAPISRRVDAALAMAQDATGGRLLIQLAAESKIAYQLREAIGSVIFMNPDRHVRALAAGYFPRPGGSPRMALTDIPVRNGDASRGQLRYYGSCATCHRFRGAGADVGPDLTDINRKFDVAGLVDAIVNPSAAIAFGFGAELFVTRGDEPHPGFLQADGQTVSIRDADGRHLTFDRETLAARIPLKSSLMPDPLLLGLSEQDIADIAAFLMKSGR
jgi:putative heme-binding domain-containing protein